MPAKKSYSEFIGKKFHRLVIRSIAEPTGNGRRTAVCRCECGEEKPIRLDGVLSGVVKSCGCFQSDMGAVQGLRNIKHGCCRRIVKRASEYDIWRQMIQRCTNPNDYQFYLYGDRGIRVCARWRSFKNFLADMGFRPSADHSIDRFPDNNGNYEPGNCRWATRKQQARNKRNNRLVTCDGMTKSVSEWAETSGISAFNIVNRLNLGWSDEDAVKQPVRRKEVQES